MSRCGRVAASGGGGDDQGHRGGPRFGYHLDPFEMHILADLSEQREGMLQLDEGRCVGEELV
jgi:hypothetical protein